MVLAQTEPKDRKEREKEIRKNWEMLANYRRWDEDTKDKGNLAGIISEEEKRAKSNLDSKRKKRENCSVWSKRKIDKEIQEAEAELRRWTRMAATATALSKEKFQVEGRTPPPYVPKTPSAPVTSQYPVYSVGTGQVTLKEGQDEKKVVQIVEGLIKVEMEDEDKEEEECKIEKLVERKLRELQAVETENRQVLEETKKGATKLTKPTEKLKIDRNEESDSITVTGHDLDFEWGDEKSEKEGGDWCEEEREMCMEEGRGPSVRTRSKTMLSNLKKKSDKQGIIH